MLASESSSEYAIVRSSFTAKEAPNLVFLTVSYVAAVVAVATAILVAPAATVNAPVAYLA